VLELETIGKRQAESEKQYLRRKKQEMVEHYYRKKRVRPLSVNPANKAKSHPHSNWPPIISGGAVESNRRRH
jgi:hypothetical protein